MALGAIMTLSCQKENGEEPGSSETLSTAPTEINFVAKDAEAVIVTVETSAKTWSASSDADWVKTSVKSGTTFSVSASNNPNTEVRTANVTVKAGSKEVKIAVSQEGKEPIAPPKDGELATAEAFLGWLANPEKDAKLIADIDLKGEDLSSAACFEAEFDGQGHKIKNAKSIAPLFELNKGKISNVEFESCSYTSTADLAIEGKSIAFLAARNEGTIDNVKFSGKFSIDCAKIENLSGATCDGPFVGIIAGSNIGVVSNCVNKGELVYKFTDAAASSAHYGYIGCIVGLTGQDGMDGAVTVKDCTNEGNLNFCFSGTTKTLRYYHLGGVVGGTPGKKGGTLNCGKIANCTNKGNISFEYTEGGSGAYPTAAGVVGYAEAYIESCNNYGTITLKTSESVAWTCPRVGGVAGFVTLGAKDCHNYGTLSLSGVYAGGTAGNRGAGICASGALGGVFSSAGPYEASNDVVFENCTNEVDLKFNLGSITGSPNNVYGGVFGVLSGKALNCVNKGSITVESPVHMNRCGGVAGAIYATLEGCSNSGNISVDCLDCHYNSDDKSSTTATTVRMSVGGVAGDCQSSTQTLTKCTNTGNIVTKATGETLPSTRTARLGGVLGGGKADDAVTFVECTSTGTVTNESKLMPATIGELYGGKTN